MYPHLHGLTEVSDARALTQKSLPQVSVGVLMGILLKTSQHSNSVHHSTSVHCTFSVLGINSHGLPSAFPALTEQIDCSLQSAQHLMSAQSGTSQLNSNHHAHQGSPQADPPGAGEACLGGDHRQLLYISQCCASSCPPQSL